MKIVEVLVPCDVCWATKGIAKAVNLEKMEVKELGSQVKLEQAGPESRGTRKSPPQLDIMV